MKRIDVINRAGRNLRQAKLRTFLTALAISVGAFTITLALAAGTGAQQYTQNLISSNGDEQRIIVMPKNSEEARAEKGQQVAPKQYSVSATPTQQSYLTSADLAKIQKVPHVASAQPLYQVQAQYMQRSAGSTKYQASVAVKQDKSKPDFVAGNLGSSEEPSQSQAAIPQSYLGVLGFKNAESAIGKTFSITFGDPANPRAAAKTMQFTVAAVLGSSSTSLSVQNSVLIGSADGETIYNFQHPGGSADQYAGITVEVDQKSNVDAAKNAIKADGYQALS
ncbi:MAG TPA: ABC transporter permease, partial [Candidatus Saccharimonadaceae bacterium]|nr:ABC transporter permease [Candidatus Saccharimonadaceae bacterium]